MAYQNPDAVAAGAPAWHLPAPQPRPKPTGIRGFTWAIWPWMSWILPAFFTFHGFLGGGGWGTLLLMLASPIFIPAMGLLGMLPRFILRKKGHAAAPAPIVWLLFVNWWAWFALTITMQDAGDSGPTDTLLRATLTARLSTEYEQIIFLAAVAIAMASWVAVLILAIRQPPPVPGAPTRDGSWDAVSWNAAFLVPALLVATVFAGVQLTALQQDAAGDTVAAVEALPIETQAQRAESNYALTQQRLSQVRELISDDDWVLREEDGNWVGSSGFGSSYGACGGADADCYTFDAGFRLELPPAGFDPEGAEFTAQLRELGWTATDRAWEWTDADGFSLDVLHYANDDGVTVEIASPSWWGDTYELRQVIGERDDSGLGRPYRFDEWPPLG